ncbi:probable serine/threonine-protein kinase PIX13 [Henckelia pumila]|uniref:probable serine/threonine-protein kinase PIX13 n=1 Tax=Henckelia pumila TaxID=405737 RepID=UPI003C6E7EFC
MGICLSRGGSRSATVNSYANQGQPSTTGSSQWSSVATTTVSSTWSKSANVSGSSSSVFSGGDHDTGSSPAFAAGQMLSHPSLRVFSFSELKNATRSFRSDTLLGEGGFGKVYKGWLVGANGEKTVVAVKKLNSDGSQGFHEWQSEINFLGRLSHPNLVKLLGYCWEGVELLLVYEFMPKGSLENHLFGRGSAVQPLPWDVRLKILIGAARGLAFLHASDRKVIYRDFKASNILLDVSYHAKLSDFGLAKMGPTASKSHITTQVMGTNGYAAPEYVATGHLYVKSDVYGFGVVLAEMLTGYRALDENRPNGKEKLVEWIKPHLTDRRKLKNVMDSRLEGKYPSRSALQIAQLSLECLENEQKNRPSMQVIVETLERIDGAPEKLHRDQVKVKSTHPPIHRRGGGQQPLHYRSPLHPKQDVDQTYPLPQRI